MNADPFAQYLEFWAPSVGFESAFDAWVQKQHQQEVEAAYVMPDLAPFRSNDGAYITSRSQWRVHLKDNNLQEFGSADIKYQQEQWQKKKAAHAARLKRATGVKPVEVQPDFQPAAPSRLSIELANRLHGRPTPQRKEFIKLALEQTKRLKRGPR